MFEQTPVITFALLAAGLALAGAAARRLAPSALNSLWRFALAFLAVASASAGASAQATSAGMTSPQGQSRIYVSDWNANRVRVFDPNTGTPHVGNIMVGEGPFGMAASPDGRRLYVANSRSDTVSVIDTRWNVVHYNVAVGDYPVRIAVSPDGKRIFVTNFDGNSVSVVYVGGTTTPWVERTIPVPYRPMEVGVRPGGRYLYVSQYEDFKIKVFDMWADFAEVDHVSVTQLGATQPIAFAFSADGDRLYVANEGGGPNAGGTVNFINSGNPAANAVERTVALPYQHLPRGQMVLTANGRHLYLPGAGQGKLLVIDTLDGTLLDPPTHIGVGPHGVAMSPDGARLFVSIEGNMLSTVNTALLATPGQNPVLWETYVEPEVAGGTRFLSVAYVTIPNCP